MLIGVPNGVGSIDGHKWSYWWSFGDDSPAEVSNAAGQMQSVIPHQSSNLYLPLLVVDSYWEWQEKELCAGYSHVLVQAALSFLPVCIFRMVSYCDGKKF